MFSNLRRLLKNRFGKKSNSTIEPDEIFLDSSNLPEFDTSQFEGRLERPISKRTFVLFAIVLFIVGGVGIGRLWFLQIENGEVYASYSENNRLHHSFLFAERGLLYDRNGEELAWNAPREGEAFSARLYSDVPGLSHLLGYVSLPQKDVYEKYYQNEYKALAGVERVFDEQLKGENGLKIVETNALGEVKSESVIEPPQDGESLTLSIDRDLTSRLHIAIKELADRAPFQGGAGAIMDVETGEVIALTSYPEYNSNTLSGNADQAAIDSYTTDARKVFLNRVVSGLYAPGSIIKPFIALGALNEGVISPEKEIVSTGSLRVPNPYVPNEFTVFRDWKAHGAVNLREALAVSSDVYFYQVGGGFENQKGIGIRNIEKYTRLFGFGEETGVAFGSEPKGVIPNPEWKAENFEDGTWRLGNTYHTAIGQYGFQTTPLQALRATAGLAHDGVLVTPTLLKGEQGRTEKIDLPPGYIEIVQAGMRDAVLFGTARGLNVPYTSVAAKTGTAEVGSQKRIVHSWVVGFFPYEKPRYAFVVLMEGGPETNTIGGVYIMRQTLDWLENNRREYLAK
ncbi:MAG: penicillin-binding transpeptidase domain-containing protein [Candidatus Paceibacterota bacterium]